MSSSIPFWGELKDYISKEKAKQNRLTDRQTNWYPLRERHTSAVMLPHVNEEPRAQRTPQPRRKKKGKTLHTSSPALGKAGQRALTKDTEKALSAQQPDLKAVKVHGKTVQPLDQKPNSRKMCPSQRVVPTLAAGWAALAGTINTLGRNAVVVSCGAAENHCGG